MSDSSPTIFKPLSIYLFVVLFFLLLTNLLQSYFRVPVTHVYQGPFHLGFDYGTIYHASLLFRNGGSPYDDVAFPLPPFAALINVPLTYLPFETAARVAYWSMLLMVLITFMISWKMFCRGNDSNVWASRAIGLIVVLSSAPTYFLIDRSNFDGVAMFFVWIGLWILFRYSNDYIGGIFLGLAALTKIYPILLLIPFTILGRWKVLVGVALSLTVSVFMHLGTWHVYAERLWNRSTAPLVYDQNVSLANLVGCVLWLFRLCSPDVQNHIAIAIAEKTYLVLLFILSAGMFFRKPSFSPTHNWTLVLFFVPFMIAVPSRAYHYEAVNLIPLIPFSCWLYMQARKKSHRTAVLALIVGIALSQFPQTAYNILLSAANFDPAWSYMVGSLGNTIAMVAFIALALIMPSKNSLTTKN